MLALWMTLAAPLGCYKNTIITGKPPNGETHTKRSRFLFWGFVGSPNYDLKKMCPDGVSRIEEEMDFGAAALTCVTCGIVTPRAVTVTCSGGQAWRLAPDSETGLVVAQAQEVE